MNNQLLFISLLALTAYITVFWGVVLGEAALMDLLPPSIVTGGKP